MAINPKKTRLSGEGLIGACYLASLLLNLIIWTGFTLVLRSSGKAQPASRARISGKTLRIAIYNPPQRPAPSLPKQTAPSTHKIKSHRGVQSSSHGNADGPDGRRQGSAATITAAGPGGGGSNGASASQGSRRSTGAVGGGHISGAKEVSAHSGRAAKALSKHGHSGERTSPGSRDGSAHSTSLAAVHSPGSKEQRESAGRDALTAASAEGRGSIRALQTARGNKRGPRSRAGASASQNRGSSANREESADDRGAGAAGLLSDENGTGDSSTGIRSTEARKPGPTAEAARKSSLSAAAGSLADALSMAQEISAGEAAGLDDTSADKQQQVGLIPPGQSDWAEPKNFNARHLAKMWNIPENQKLILPKRLDLALPAFMEVAPGIKPLTPEQIAELRKLLHQQNLQHLNGLTRDQLKKLLEARKDAERPTTDVNATDPEFDLSDRPPPAPRNEAPRRWKSTTGDETAALPEGLRNPFTYRPWDPAWRERYAVLSKESDSAPENVFTPGTVPKADTKTQIAAVPPAATGSTFGKQNGPAAGTPAGTDATSANGAPTASSSAQAGNTPPTAAANPSGTTNTAAPNAGTTGAAPGVPVPAGTATNNEKAVVGASPVGINAADTPPPNPATPATGTPGAGTPATGTPGAGTPAAGPPGNDQAGVLGAGQTNPGPTQTNTGSPGTAQTGASQPAGSPPQAGVLGTGEPTIGQPAAGQPSAGVLGGGQPAAGQPGAGQGTGVLGTGSGQSTRAVPAAGQPGSGVLGADTTQPASGVLGAGTGQPASGVLGAGQVAAGNSGTGPTGTGVLGAGQPGAGQPGNTAAGSAGAGVLGPGQPAAGASAGAPPDAGAAQQPTGDGSTAGADMGAAGDGMDGAGFVDSEGVADADNSSNELGNSTETGFTPAEGVQPNMPAHNHDLQKGIPGALVLPPLPPLGSESGKGLSPHPLRPMPHAAIQSPRPALPAPPAILPRARVVSPVFRAAVGVQPEKPRPILRAPEPVPPMLTVGSTSAQGTVPIQATEAPNLPVGTVSDSVNGLGAADKTASPAPVARNPYPPTHTQKPAGKLTPQAQPLNGAIIKPTTQGAEGMQSLEKPARKTHLTEQPLGKKQPANSQGIKEGSLNPLPPTPLPDSDSEIGDGSGLKGEYYLGRNFDQYEFTRADSNLDFIWATEAAPSPSPKLPQGSDYSVRWTGKIEPRYSETYTLYAVADDGVRVWINHKLLVDDWTLHPMLEYSGKIRMEAGKQYDIRVDYFESNGGGAGVGVYWESPSQKKEFIPEDRLFYPLAGDKANLALDEKPHD